MSAASRPTALDHAHALGIFSHSGPRLLAVLSQTLESVGLTDVQTWRDHHSGEHFLVAQTVIQAA